MNKSPIVIKEGFKKEEFLRFKNREEVKKKIPLAGCLKIPVVDNENRVKDIVFVYFNGGGKIQVKEGGKPKFVKEGVKKVLITGGAGYLGSVLCRKLLKEGYKVRVLDNLNYSEEGIKELYANKNFEFFKGDIRNIAEITEALKGVDAVIHLAAIVGDLACSADPEEALEINYLSTKMMVESCKYLQINRFIFASTCSVYGINLTSTEKLTENSPLNPISLYAKTKLQSERVIFGAMDENFSPVILRMGTLYGYSPNMRFDLVVNLLTAQAMFENEITIFGGGQWRPFLHVEDAAEAYMRCLEAPLEKIRGEIFNVASENYKLIRVAKIVKFIFPKIKIRISKKIIDKRNYKVSSEKILRTLNYHPKKRIIDGILEIKKAIKKNLIKNYKNFKYRLPQTLTPL